MIQQQHPDFAASVALLAEFEKGNNFKISSVMFLVLRQKQYLRNIDTQI
jgi:hypothetical protein